MDEKEWKLSFAFSVDFFNFRRNITTLNFHLKKPVYGLQKLLKKFDGIYSASQISFKASWNGEKRSSLDIFAFSSIILELKMK